MTGRKIIYSPATPRLPHDFSVNNFEKTAPVRQNPLISQKEEFP
jgi:hypothetical protein